MKDILELTSIEEAFPENKFMLFRAYCKRKGVTLLKDLTMELIEEHASRKNVKNAIVKEIKQRINPTIHDDHNNIEREHLAENAIEQIFIQGFFRTFLEYCKKKEIKTIEELTNNHLEGYSEIPGVGVEKINAIKRKVKEYLLVHPETNLKIDFEHADATLITNKESSKAKIVDVFSEGLFISFRRFCKQNKLVTLDQLTGKHIDAFSRLKGVGKAKIEAVQRKRDIYFLANQGTIVNNGEKQETSPNQIIDREPNMFEKGNEGTQFITDVFPETFFLKFRKYCEINHIKSITEITNKHLDEFSLMRGVGEGRVKAVRQRIDEYVSRKKDVYEPTKFDSGEFYEVIKEHDVQDLLFFYGCNSHSTSKLKIKDIEGRNLDELKDQIEPDLLLTLSNRLKKQKNANEIVSRLIVKFSARELDILHQRYGMGKTLEEVANHFKLSRERIRQITKKLIKMTSIHLKREKFSTSIRLGANSKSFVTRQELIHLIDDEHHFIINLLKQENLLFTYFNNLDFFFFDDQNKQPQAPAFMCGVLNIEEMYW